MCAALEPDFDLDRGVAATVDDLPSAHIVDDRHRSSPSGSGRPDGPQSTGHGRAGPPGTWATRSRLVLPATPNGMPPATAIVSPGLAKPSRVTIAQALS